MLCESTCLSDIYEERIAIAEYDREQPHTQVERIAYLDAFISALVAPPYDGAEGDWLADRMTAREK